MLLIVILIVALIWRGPRTLPQLGNLFGRGVRAARDEASRLSSERSNSDKDQPPP